MSGIESAVSVDWLRARLDATNIRVVDVRWSLKASGRAAYAAGHVPGAVFLDLDTDLSPAEGPGRHPIPGREQVEQVFGAIGVDRDTHVIAYDDGGGAVAARVWFLLRRHGHARVSILDGGYRAWSAASLPISTDVPKHERRGLTLAPAPQDDVVDKVYVEAMLPRIGRGALLIDARSGDRYRGQSEPIDARAGHIPGAKNAPWDHNLEPDARGIPILKSAGELRRLYAALGAGSAEEIVVYCGSSVTACLGLLSLDCAGFRGARVYEGSWSEWARDSRLPAAHGDE